MRIQVLVPIIIGLAACGIGSAFIYHQLKEQQKDDKKKRRRSESDPDHPLTSIDVITSAELSIHNEFVPAIVGKDSLNLKSLEAKTRTRISFKTSRTSDDHHTCVIEGTLDAIEDARKIILMIASKPPVLVTEQLDVSQSACGKIIGRCGEMLQEICRKSNAKVSVNSNETSNQRQVVITGTRMQVNAALALINEKIQEDTDLRRAIEESELKRERRGPLKSSSNLSGSLTSLPESIQSSTTNTGRSSLTTTGQMEVYVSAIASPSKLWIQIVGPQSTELDTMIEQMTEYYDNTDNQLLHAIEEPCLDQIVASQFKWDNKWYRARIVAILPNEFEDGGMVLDIYFLDYGDSAYVAPHEVFQLRADFLTLRFQAIECFLANVAPLDFREQEALKREQEGGQGDTPQQQQRYKWDRRAVERFEQLTHVAQWELLLCRVVCHDEVGDRKAKAERGGGLGREGSPVPGVELYDVANGVDVNVGQQMIGEGLAVPTMYQKGGMGGGLRLLGIGSAQSIGGSQNGSRTLSPVGFTGGLMLNGKGSGGSSTGICNQVAISENSSNENFENASYESRQQQMRQ